MGYPNFIIHDRAKSDFKNEANIVDASRIDNNNASFLIRHDVSVSDVYVMVRRVEYFARKKEPQ